MQEQVSAECKRRKILRSQRHVAQDRDRKCCLRFGERTKLGLLVSPHLCPEPVGQPVQAPQNGGVIELPQGAFVLAGQPEERRRHFADKALEFGEHLSVDFHPLVRNLNERFAKIVIEGVFFTVDAVETPTQDTLEVVGRDQIGERQDGGRLVPLSTKAVTAAWIWSRRSRSVRGANARGRASAAKGSETPHQDR